MSADALKRLWPFSSFPSPRLVQRTSDQRRRARVVIGVNSPLENLKGGRPAGPRRRVDARCGGDQLRHPAGGRPAGAGMMLILPCLLSGADAQIAVRKAAADSRRRLVVFPPSSGLFEVPDTAPHAARRRTCTSSSTPLVPAAVELLGLGPPSPFLRSCYLIWLIYLTSLGARWSLWRTGLKPDLPPGSTNYGLDRPTPPTSVEHMILGQKGPGRGKKRSRQ